jgi:(p)ppGpp synthase/HD superfamily hydrolase
LNVAQTNLQLYRQLSERKTTAPDLAAVRCAYELAASLFQGVYRASGKPFIAHLVGTASVLVQDGAPPPLVLAGLLHAAYVQGDFGDGPPGATVARRRKVGEAIGADAEQLVARYTTLPWHVGDLSAHRDLPASLEPLDRDVLRIRLANEVEELVDFGPLYHRDAESRRALAIEALPVWTEWAKAVSAEAIAAELRTNAAPLSTFHAHEALQTDRVFSYRPPTVLAPTVAGRVRSAVDRLRGVARRLRHEQPHSVLGRLKRVFR